MKSINFTKKPDLDCRASEAYKTLRTNIQFCGDEIKVIMLTSCLPNEGKSSIFFNLAESFAEIGKRVVMVDADLRKSVLVGRYMVGEIQGGLSHYLAGQAELSEVLYETDIDNMDIIFSGAYSPNPSELLNHRRFTEMLKRLREDYDYILIDTPPLGAVIDGAIVAKVSDGAIMIIEANVISYRFAREVQDQLEKSNCRILGTILNKVPINKNGSYGKYYYGKYSSEYYGE